FTRLRPIAICACYEKTTRGGTFEVGLPGSISVLIGDGGAQYITCKLGSSYISKDGKMLVAKRRDAFRLRRPYSTGQQWVWAIFDGYDLIVSFGAAPRDSDLRIPIPARLLTHDLGVELRAYSYAIRLYD